jgi:MFS family permease
MADDPSSRRGSLVAVFLTVFIDLLGFGMVIPLVAIYAKEIVQPENAANAETVVAMLAVSYPLMQFLFAPVWGRVSDRVGRRPILLLGLFGSVVFYAVFGYATSVKNLTWMFVSRAGAGLFGATIPTAQAYIADTTSVENRAKGMAVIGAAFGLGFTFGPLLASVALVDADKAGLSPWPGYVASGLSAFAFLFALAKLPESLHAGSASASRKLLDLGALRVALSVPTVASLMLTWFVANVSFAAFEAILGYLLKQKVEQGGFGYEIQTVVLLFAVIGLVHAVAQGFVRQMSKRMSEAALATGGTMAAVVGFLVLAWGTYAHSLPVLVVGMLVESAGYAFVPAPVQSLISRRSDPKQQGAILGVGQSLGSLARIVGYGTSFLLFGVSASLPFWVGAGLMTLAALLVLVNARRGTDYADRSEPVVAGERGA